MSAGHAVRSFALVLVALSAAGTLSAEPMFLSRQYARCTTCHFSPTGGGLLTPYGRSLSHNELSMTRGTSPSQEAGKEESFLYGVLGESLGKLHLGIDVRPARVTVDTVAPGLPAPLFVERNFVMNADVLAAWHDGPWTLYGQAGREPLGEGGRFKSYEYWASYLGEKGFGVRAGRFFPAFGVRLADHTAYTRRGLGIDRYDQVFGVELSHVTEKHLIQVSAGPGLADAVLDDDGRSTFTLSARYQRDLGTRLVLVASGLHRGSADLAPRNTIAGLAIGWSPHPRIAVWNEADAHFVQNAADNPGYTLLNETSFEVYRGVWLRVSPQFVSEPEDSSTGSIRWAFGLNIFPRTHYNIDITFYRDSARGVDAVSKTWLLQLHLYL